MTNVFSRGSRSLGSRTHSIIKLFLKIPRNVSNIKRIIIGMITNYCGRFIKLGYRVRFKRFVRNTHYLNINITGIPYYYFSQLSYCVLSTNDLSFTRYNLATIPHTFFKKNFIFLINFVNCI